MRQSIKKAPGPRLTPPKWLRPADHSAILSSGILLTRLRFAEFLFPRSSASHDIGALLHVSRVPESHRSAACGDMSGLMPGLTSPVSTHRKSGNPIWQNALAPDTYFGDLLWIRGVEILTPRADRSFHSLRLSQ